MNHAESTNLRQLVNAETSALRQENERLRKENAELLIKARRWDELLTDPVTALTTLYKQARDGSLVIPTKPNVIPE